MRHYLTLFRPLQWMKNLFVAAPVLFAAEFGNAAAIQATLVAVVAFCVMSGAVYAWNDAADVKEDRAHPEKKSRPVARGNISPPNAIIAGLVLALIALAITKLLPPPCYMILLLYAGLNLAYTLYLKRIALVDVMVVASGFVLRLFMGGEAAHVPLSPWIILTTFLLCLFIGFGKRYHDLDKAKNKKFPGYSLALLDRLIMLSATLTVACYALYAEHISEQSSPYFLVTLPFVLFGIFRYMQLIYLKGAGGVPEKMFLRDRALLVNAVLWLLLTLGLLSHAA